MTNSMYTYVRGVTLPQPEPYNTHVSTIPIAFIPFVVGAIEARITIDTVVRADYRYAAQQLARYTQMAIINGSTDIARLYRLLDNYINGTAYSVAGDGSVSPAIPDVPAALYTPASAKGTNEAVVLRMQEILAQLQSQQTDINEDNIALIGELVQIVALLA